jgi:hypothetical protein
VPPVWSATLSGGYSNDFQMILGSKFGDGPDLHNKLTLGVQNRFVRGDALSVFGWSTTDIPTLTPNYQAGLLYKMPLLQSARRSLSVTASGQRWILPMVGVGTKDWFFVGNMSYGTAVKRLPLGISVDSYSLLKSNLPTGSAIYPQAWLQHPLWARRDWKLALRQGPAYTYSWNLYGANGSRVVRYGAALITSWRGTTAELGYRKQFGLQDKIPNNGYWSVTFSQRVDGPVPAR